MRECGDDVVELIHDGCPVALVGDAPFAYVNVFKSHVNVGFYRGCDLNDPQELLEGNGSIHAARETKTRPRHRHNVVSRADTVRLSRYSTVQLETQGDITMRKPIITLLLVIGFVLPTAQRAKSLA